MLRSYCSGTQVQPADGRGGGPTKFITTPVYHFLANVGKKRLYGCAFGPAVVFPWMPPYKGP